MSDNSAIQWTDATWGPTLGCTKVSPGCESCYAIRSAHRLAGNPNPKIGPLYQGLTRKYNDGSLNWTGKVTLAEDRLNLPLRWKEPRRIFVDSQSDLFHEAVPDAFIAAVFQTMADTPRHTYQILTKRPERMRAFLDAKEGLGCVAEFTGYPYPLLNVWLGVSAENQATADERIPLLLETPAAVRFISAEPLLGPLNLTRLRSPGVTWLDCLTGREHIGPSVAMDGPHLDWVITGGESGPNHRTFDPQWACDIRDQCVAAGVAFLHKQNGGRTSHAGGRLLDGRTWDQFPEARP